MPVWKMQGRILNIICVFESVNVDSDIDLSSNLSSGNANGNAPKFIQGGKD